jgi:hypothetical protein
MPDLPEDLPQHLKEFIEENGMPENATIDGDGFRVDPAAHGITWTPGPGSRTSNTAKVTWNEEMSDPENIPTMTVPEEEMPELTPEGEERIDLLARAAMIVTQDRNLQYGEPEDVFVSIGAFWGTYLGLTTSIAPQDVAVMMILLKVARLAGDPNKADTWIDIAGYSAIGGAMRADPHEEQE